MNSARSGLFSRCVLVKDQINNKSDKSCLSINKKCKMKNMDNDSVQIYNDDFGILLSNKHSHDIGNSMDDIDIDIIYTILDYMSISSSSKTHNGKINYFSTKTNTKATVSPSSSPKNIQNALTFVKGKPSTSSCTYISKSNSSSRTISNWSLLQSKTIECQYDTDNEFTD
eukprot:257306_1